MSGTSADGVDAVLAEIGPRGNRLAAHIIRHVHRIFPAVLRKRILHAAVQGSVAEICELNFLLGAWFAEVALAVVHRAGLKPHHIAAIGSHGQTVHHLPNGPFPSTLQIGEPAIIAERTGITTVADFRVRDMAAGGQGAPLVSFADWTLFADPKRPRIVQNIGGIANLTFLPSSIAPVSRWRARAGRSLTPFDDILAFDTGPGNMVIDAVVSELTGGRRSFDTDGKLAAKGTVSIPLLEEMLQHPFFQKYPPKTTGREEFGQAFVGPVVASARRRRIAPVDLLATVTALTAQTIAQAYRRFVFHRLSPDDLASVQVILGGGGAKNRTLVRMLQDRLRVGEILTHEAFGIDSSAKEAFAFAILAYQTLLGKPSNVPSATGACRPVVLGKIVPT